MSRAVTAQATAGTPSQRLSGLGPICNSHTRLLVLGSFPGVRSLQMQQYYAHPQNQFWRILGMLWRMDLSALPYAARCDEVLRRGLGIWDVYAYCERQGSLDSAICNATVNDLALLLKQCPHVSAIAHNGGESWKHRKHTAALGVAVYKLPSTSPANASWSLERKLAAWREVFQQHGLCE